MSVRKIEVNEDDLKKVILMLKLSKPHIQIPHEDLALCNMWRVSGKLADKLMRKAQLVMVVSKGRITLKSVGEVNSEIVTGSTSTEDTSTDEEVKETSDTSVETSKVPRCRKRKH